MMRGGIIGSGEYRGYRWVAKYGAPGIKCAYVDIEQNHYLVGMIFGSDGRLGQPNAADLLPVVHGGVTYAERHGPDWHVAGFTPGRALVGWDYGHANDVYYSPTDMRMQSRTPDENVFADIKSAIDYILANYDL